MSEPSPYDALPPQVLQMLMAARLRQRREELGLTIEEVASRTYQNKTSVGRQERADGTAAKGPAMQALIELYGFSEQVATELRAMSRAASRNRGLIQRQLQLGRGVPPWLTSFIGLEYGADRLDVFSMGIPGLLQTEEYARAVINPDDPSAADGDLARMRPTRRALALESGRAVCALIDEGAVRRVVGGPEVMRRQWRVLDELYASTIDVRIIPFSRGGYAAHSPDGFTILTIAGESVAYVENMTGGEFLPPDEVEACQALFATLRGAALSRSESRALLKTLAGEQE